MTELTYHPGDVIFREGDSSGFVCLVSEGSLDVLKNMDGREVILGAVGEGEFVGEMGVIEQRPRGATVRARTEVRLRLLSEEEFMQRISEDPETSLMTLRRLSERLRATDERLAEAASGGDPAAGTDAGEAGAGGSGGPGALRLEAGSPIVAAILPEAGVTVETLPFHVGRPPGPGEPEPAAPLALALVDEAPYRLSRLHFTLVEKPGGEVAVRDVGSTLGTLVNGVFIGQHAPRAFAALRIGENEIVAGGRDSPYVFRIRVPEA